MGFKGSLRQRLLPLAALGLFALATPVSASADLGGISAPSPTAVPTPVAVPTPTVALPTAPTVAAPTVEAPAAPTSASGSASVSASVDTTTPAAAISAAAKAAVSTKAKARGTKARGKHGKAARKTKSSRTRVSTGTYAAVVLNEQEMYIPFPPMVGCQGEAITTQGQFHIVWQVYSDGSSIIRTNTIGVTGTAPNPFNPLTLIKYSISEESKYYLDQAIIEEQRKVIAQGETGLLPDDMFVRYTIDASGFPVVIGTPEMKCH